MDGFFRADMNIADRIVCETERLCLRHFVLQDAAFALRLLNEREFIENIADKGVRTLQDAREYLRREPLASYAQSGFGLNLVALKPSGIPIGMCGLIKRETFEEVDIGYALLTEYCGMGYAHEATAAVLEVARTRFRLERVLAVVNRGNHSSTRLLGKLGFGYQRMVRWSVDGPELTLWVRRCCPPAPALNGSVPAPRV